MTTLSFDVSIGDLFLPLVVGASVVIALNDDVKDGRLLGKLLDKHHITLMPATPATWRLLIDSGWLGSPLKAISTGEPLPKELADQLLTRVSSLWNLYGPTEVTVWATCDQVLPDEPITIGRAIHGITIYVVDRFGMPVPRYIPGELYMGGLGVTRGYVGRQDLTDERFIVLKGVPELSKVYKSGDLVRLRNDGKIEYIGRNDNQVKVRGFRIELGEIEAAIAKCPGVTQALVMVREDRPSDRRLVAYVESQETSVTEELLTQWCHESLPFYMVPQHAVIMTQMPLLPNGKIDRKALAPPVLDGLAGGQDDLPRGDVEEKLATIWGELLGIETVPVTRSFYNLGGHSLLAMRMLAKAQKQFDTVISLRTLLEHNSVRALAAVIAGPGKLELKAIPQLSDGKGARLSIIQERVYYLDLLNPGEIFNLLPDGRIIRGPFQSTTFAEVIRTIVQRHPMMRAIIVKDAAAPRMLVREQICLDLTPVDLTHLSPDDQQALIAEEGRLMASRPMDVHVENLFRFKLYKLSTEVHVFATVFHHVVWDGWCFDIFWSEIHQLYLAAIKGQKLTLPEEGCRYLDFALWHRQQSASPEYMNQLAFWKSYLKDMEFLELPTDEPRPARKESLGKRQQFFWDKRQNALIQKLAKEEQTTPFVMMLTMFKYLLALYSGQRDIIVGTPVQGRGHPDFANVIGYFVNTLVLRTDFRALSTFKQMIRAVKQSAEGAFKHEDIAFEEIVKALALKPDPSRTTIYSVMFAYQDTSNRATDWRPLTIEQINLPQNAVSTDLVLWMRKNDAGLTGGFDYRSDLFTDERIGKMIDHLTLLMETLTAAPDRQVFADPILLPGVTLTQPEEEPAMGLLERIAANARRKGDKVFIVDGKSRVSGFEFLHQVDSHQATKRAGRMGDKVSCTPDWLWLPRLISAMSQGGNITLTATTADHQKASKEIGPQGGASREEPPHDRCRVMTDLGVVDCFMQSDGRRMAGLDAEVPIPEHVSVSRSVNGPDQLRWLLFALGCGATLTLEDYEINNPYLLSRVVEQNSSTLFHFTLPALANMIAAGVKLPFSAHIAVSGGPVGTRIIRELTPCPAVRFLLAAPRHASYSLCGRIKESKNGKSGLSWRPLAGEVTVAPRGIDGPSPLATGPFMPGNIRVHAKTGDTNAAADTGYIGYMSQYGLHLLGRHEDAETKANYFRIRREEQQRVMQHLDDVIYAQFATVSGRSRLSVLLSSAMNPDQLAALRLTIKRSVPLYLMADEINFVEFLPLDRGGLVYIDHPMLGISSNDRADEDPPQTAAEIALAAIWMRVLGVKRVRRQDNFFDLGGYSLLPLLVINEVEQQTGVRLDVGMFLTQNLCSIAAQSGFARQSPIEYEVAS